jgi:hypothetical protein
MYATAIAAPVCTQCAPVIASHLDLKKNPYKETFACWVGHPHAVKFTMKYTKNIILNIA